MSEPSLLPGYDALCRQMHGEDRWHIEPPRSLWSRFVAWLRGPI